MSAQGQKDEAGLMLCGKHDKEMEPIQVKGGFLCCPLCGDLMDEETLHEAVAVRSKAEWVTVMREKVQACQAWLGLVSYFTGPLTDESYNVTLDQAVDDLAMYLLRDVGPPPS